MGQANTVRFLREKFDVLQKDLICSGISRPYLSNLENDKVTLSNEMAYRIAMRFNEVFSAKAIDVRLVHEDLQSMERLHEKLELNEALDYFQRIENINREDMKSLESKYTVVQSPYEYAALNGLLGSYYYNEHELFKATRYLEKAFDSYMARSMYDKAVSILYKVVHALVELGDLESAQAYDRYFWDELLTKHEDMDSRVLSEFYRTSALLQWKLGDFDCALSRLNDLDLIGNGIESHAQRCALLKARILIDTRCFSQADDTLSLILQETKDRGSRIHANLMKTEMDVLMTDSASFAVNAEQTLILIEGHNESDEKADFLLSLMLLAERLGNRPFIVKHQNLCLEVLSASGRQDLIEGFIMLYDRLEKEQYAVAKAKTKLVGMFFRFV